MSRLHKVARQAGLTLLVSALAGTSALLVIEGLAIVPPDSAAEAPLADTAPKHLWETSPRIAPILPRDPPLDTSAVPRTAPESPRAKPQRSTNPRPTPVHIAQVATPDVPTAREKPARPPRVAPRSDTRAVLLLVVNGVSFGEVVATLTDDDVLVPLADLRRAGIVADLPVRPGASTPVVSLKALAARLGWSIDHARLALLLDADPVLFAPTRLSLAPDRPVGIVYSDDVSGFINYGVHADTQGGASIFGEIGFHAFDAFVSTTVSGGNHSPFIRGQSQVVIDDRDSLLRWTLGDVFQGSGTLGGGAFLAGITLTRELSLDPYLVTRPGLAFEGATRAPGTLEIYIDDALVRRLDVPAGTFQLDDLPIPTRSGNARYVLRDALGGTQTFERPYAMTSDLLDPGLHQYSYSVGVERTSLATESFEYGQPVALGRHRVGLTSNLTLGWRAELAPLAGLASGGVEATMLLPFGKVDLGLHASTEQHEGAGVAGYLAWTLPGPGVNVSLYALGRSDAYQQLGLDPTVDRHLLETGGIIGWNADPLHGSIEGRFSRSRDGLEVARGRVTLGVSIMHGVDFQLAVGVTHDQHETGIEGMAMLSIVPGSRFTANIAERLGPDGSETSISTNMPMRNTELDGGLHTSLTIDEGLRFIAKPQLQTAFGLYQLSVAYDEQGLNATADASGALVFVAGAGFELVRAVTESFAIVDLPDDVEVRVLRDNREVGRTDDGGIVVNDLLPYYANRIAIAVDDLPLDQEVSVTEKLIAPPYRSGARVTFDMRPTRYVRGRMALLEADTGAVIVPANGSLIVVVEGKDVVSPLGRAAELELAGLAPGRYRATVMFGAERCAFWLEIRETHASIDDLGLLTCQLTKETK